MIMKRIALILTALCASIYSRAQISITSTTLSYKQNFDALDTISVSPYSTSLPTGWSVFEYRGTTGTSARIDQKYGADAGTSSTGDTYSYGTVGSTERALGALGSGTIASSFGAKFVNNTGTTITGFAIQYRGEQWRMGATGRANTDSLRFFYSTTASGVSDTGNGFVENSALMLTTINMSATTGTLNGNLGTNSTIKSANVPVTVPVGGTLVIRWVDRNVAGNDDGLAIDSLSILFTMAATTTPNVIALSPLPMATGVDPSADLTIAFDKPVTVGIGDIIVKERIGQTTFIFRMPSSEVTVNGNVATVSLAGILGPDRVYHVLFDSTVFDSAGYYTTGIYDTTLWTFSTIGVGVQVMEKNASLPLSVVNPAANGDIQIVSTLPQAAVLTARIYNVDGREILTRTFAATKGDNHLRLQTSLPSGNYLIKVDDGREWGSAKVTMQ
jgi:hypothetical protein